MVNCVINYQLWNQKCLPLWGNLLSFSKSIPKKHLDTSLETIISCVISVKLLLNYIFHVMLLVCFEIFINIICKFMTFVDSNELKFILCYTCQGFPKSSKGWGGGEIGNFTREGFFYQVQGTWGTFSKLKTTFCEYWTSIKIKIIMT